MKIKSSSEKSHVGWKWVEKEIGGLWLEVCTAELMCVSVDAWVYLCVSSYWDQMKYPSVSMAIDQSAAAPMMDITALIAPLMPSVSLTHTLLHSHSFIYLPLFFPPCSLLPSNSAERKQKQITDLMKLSLEGGLAWGRLSHISWQLPQWRTSATLPTPRSDITFVKKVPDKILVVHIEGYIRQFSCTSGRINHWQWASKWNPGINRAPECLWSVHGNVGISMTSFCSSVFFSNYMWTGLCIL